MYLNFPFGLNGPFGSIEVHLCILKCAPKIFYKFGLMMRHQKQKKASCMSFQKTAHLGHMDQFYPQIGPKPLNA